jgi:hypothetical protein
MNPGLIFVINKKALLVPLAVRIRVNIAVVS